MAVMYLKSTYAEIELPAAEFGNTETVGRNQTIEYTYSGKAYVSDHGYPTWRYGFVLAGLDWKQKEALYAFFRHQAQMTLYTFDVGLTTDHTTIKDWPATLWIKGCRFASTTLEFVETVDGAYDVSFELSRVSTEDGDIIRLNSGYKVT